MKTLKFNRELYSKTALLKAAYNYTDRAYLHLDADEMYYYVTIEPKTEQADIREQDFMNEMLAQSVRHVVYCGTKNIRELLFARAMGTSVITRDEPDKQLETDEMEFQESDILKDWFSADEENKN